MSFPSYKFGFVFIPPDMCDDLQLIERTLNIIESCMVPNLDFNFDSQPIGKEDFRQFRTILDDQLHVLLDILYQNGNLLRTQEFDNQEIKLKSNFIQLACEQTEKNKLFQSEQGILIASLNKLLNDNFKSFHVNVIKSTIDKFKEKLNKNSWKRSFGSVFGFVRFCEILTHERREDVDDDFIIFALSVGSNLITLIDPQFRTLGLKIYRILLTNGDKDKIQNLNIHEVIYKESFDLVRKSNEYDFNDHLLEVLYEISCLQDQHVKSSKWCKYDAIMNEILEKATLESDAKIFLLLLNKITKFCEISYEKNLENYRTLRWTNKLTEFMIRESTRILNNAENGLKILSHFHSIYIVCFSNFAVEILDEKFTDFTRKLILVLMQVANNFRDNKIMIDLIIKFIETIREHQKLNTQLTNILNKLIEKVR